MTEKLLNAGYIALSAYLPAKKLSQEFAVKLSKFLDSHTEIPKEYIESIKEDCILPGNIETNEEGWKSKPWYNAWVKNLSEKKQLDPFQGTEERRRVPMDPDSVKNSIYPHPMLPSDAEVIAAAMAICSSDIDPNEIDLVMSHSQVPDHPLPQNASLLQHKLQLKNAGAYGVDTCCSSFVSMTELACSLVKSGIKKNVLIVSSFIDSHVLDRSTHFSVDTGDGAVAAIVSTPTDGFGYITSHSTSHGSRHDGIIYQRRSPLLLKRIDSGPDYSQLFTTFHNPVANKEIAKNAAIDLKFVVDKSLEKAQLTIEDMDHLSTHQPVAWAGEVWRESIGIPKDKFHETFKKYANIATCAAPVNLLESIESNLVNTGNNVILTSSGAGENHICIIMQLSEQLINNVISSSYQSVLNYENEFSRN